MEQKLQILHLSEITTHDMYEIAYAHSYPGNHWSPESLYLEDEPCGISILAPCLNRVFPNYNYYGPERIELEQWDQIKALCRGEHPEDPSVQAFFEEIQRWLEQGNDGADYFWILGP